MSPWPLLAGAWEWQPSVLLGCAALLAGYLGAAGLRLSRAALSFLAGILVLLLALESPLDVLGDTYLFSAHMLQHLLLELVIPPLLILGIPASLAGRVMDHPLAGRAGRVLGQPVAAWILGIGTLWAWHAPALYNAALENENIHIVQHLCFLVTATIFWWPVATPARERRLPPPVAVFYLMAAGMASTLLGILLAFAPRILYPAYLHPADPLGILPLIREGWGLSPAADQRLGGLFLWIPGGLAYLGAMLVTLARWFIAGEDSAHAAETRL